MSQPTELANERPTPLDILLHVMHAKWLAQDYAGAVALARIAAPYLHPRLGAASGRPERVADTVAPSLRGGKAHLPDQLPDQLTDAELAAQLVAGQIPAAPGRSAAAPTPAPQLP